MDTPLSEISDIISGLYNRHIPLTLNMSIQDIGRGVEQVFEINYELSADNKTHERKEAIRQDYNDLEKETEQQIIERRCKAAVNDLEEILGPEARIEQPEDSILPLTIQRPGTALPAKAMQYGKIASEALELYLRTQEEFSVALEADNSGNVIYKVLDDKGRQKNPITSRLSNTLEQEKTNLLNTIKKKINDYLTDERGISKTSIDHAMKKLKERTGKEFEEFTYSDKIEGNTATIKIQPIFKALYGK